MMTGKPPCESRAEARGLGRDAVAPCLLPDVSCSVPAGSAPTPSPACASAGSEGGPVGSQGQCRCWAADPAPSSSSAPNKALLQNVLWLLSSHLPSARTSPCGVPVPLPLPVSPIPRSPRGSHHLQGIQDAAQPHTSWGQRCGSASSMPRATRSVQGELSGTVPSKDKERGVTEIAGFCCSSAQWEHHASEGLIPGIFLIAAPCATA